MSATKRENVLNELCALFELSRTGICKAIGYSASTTPALNWINYGSDAFQDRLVTWLTDNRAFLLENRGRLTRTGSYFPEVFAGTTRKPSTALFQMVPPVGFGYLNGKLVSTQSNPPQAAGDRKASTSSSANASDAAHGVPLDSTASGDIAETSEDSGVLPKATTAQTEPLDAGRLNPVASAASDAQPKSGESVSVSTQTATANSKLPSPSDMTPHSMIQTNHLAHHPNDAPVADAYAERVQWKEYDNAITPQRVPPKCPSCSREIHGQLYRAPLRAKNDRGDSVVDLVCASCACDIVANRPLLLQGSAIPGAKESLLALSAENLLVLGSWPASILFICEPASAELNSHVATVFNTFVDGEMKLAVLNDTRLLTDPVLLALLPNPPSLDEIVGQCFACLLVGGIPQDEWGSQGPIPLLDWLKSTRRHLVHVMNDQPLDTDEWERYVRAAQNHVTHEMAEIVLRHEAVIGHGAYGTLILAKWEASKDFDMVAKYTTIKRSEKGYIAKQLFTSFEREVAIYANVLSHSPSAVPLHAVVVNTNASLCELIIVMAKMEGDWKDLVDDRLHRLRPVDHCCMAAEIAHGLVLLHQGQYAHRDVKMGNLLFKLDANREGHLPRYHAFLADFGISKKIVAGEANTPMGFQVAPTALSTVDPNAIGLRDEVLLGDVSVDIFSLGCVLYELIAANDPAKPKSWSHLTLKQGEFLGDAIVAAYKSGDVPCGAGVGRKIVDTHVLGPVILACWAQADRLSMQGIYDMILDVLQGQFPLVAKAFHISVLFAYVSTRIESSETPYAFHWRKLSRLNDHARFQSLLHAAPLVLAKFEVAQLRVLSALVLEKTFVTGLRGNVNVLLDRLSTLHCRPNSREALQRRWCLYLYVNKADGKGYVGISGNPTFRSRDSGHKRGNDHFDRVYKQSPDGWHRLVLFAAQDEHDFNAVVATQMEPLLIVLLNTSVNRENPMGYNVQPGAKLTYRQYLDQQ